MRSRQLYTSCTATTTGTVYFDVPDNTTIRGVAFAVSVPTVGSAGDYIEAEITLSSSNQTATNDAQGICGIMSANASGGGTPANISTININQFTPCAVQARKGERVYLNVTESGSATWRIRALVWFD